MRIEVRRQKTEDRAIIHHRDTKNTEKKEIVEVENQNARSKYMWGS